MIIIYADGSANNSKEGPASRNGGWGAILMHNEYHKKISGSEKNTSSSRMELTAVIRALQALKRSDLEVHVHSDSQYVIKGISEWSKGWIQRGWKNSNGDPVSNKDLWLILLALNKKYRITWVWVKGHSGHASQEIAHHLAFDAYKDNC
jgi:ribonuclease HI